MAKFKLSRREILGGAMALPALEIMAERRARGAAAPRRYVVMYTGVSLTNDGAPLGNRQKYWLPAGAGGPNYPLTNDLSPLGKDDRTGEAMKFTGYDVQSEVSLVSGLKIPWGGRAGEFIPPGARCVEFHGSTNGPQLTGLRYSNPGFDGPTSDQIVEANPAITGGTVISSLQLGVQADVYQG